MPSRDILGEPQLTEFVGGYAGPAANEYRGGNVKVIAAIIYKDGILIEWLVGPIPDLSWIEDEDESSSERMTYLDRFRDQPDMIERLRESRRLSNFWNSATLVDDLGGKYVGGWGDSQSRDGSTYKGHAAFSPSPPLEARELIVRAHDLAITIALEGRQKA